MSPIRSKDLRFQIGLQRGSTGAQVTGLRQYLGQFGYLPTTPGGAVADVYNDTVEDAVRRYQAFNKLKVTGTIDTATIEFMKRPRCGVSDASRMSLLSYKVSGKRWNKDQLTYRFVNFCSDLSEADTRNAIQQAFALWRNVVPLSFREVTGTADADILIRFAAKDHGDGDPFDGSGTVLAHASDPGPGRGGDIHFDEDETWSVNLPPSGVDLITVAAHEIGHALGLDHSDVAGSLMNPYYTGDHRYLHDDDIKGIQSIYGQYIQQVPGWFGWENQGGGVAITDLNGNGRPDLIVFHIDNPGGENHGYYRIGRDLDSNGAAAGGWTNPVAVPGWFGAENQAGCVAVTDLNGNGRPDLVVFHIDNPGGENCGYYRIGRDLDANGNAAGGWTAPIRIPGWFGNENQHGGIAIADLNGNGRPDLVVFHIDNPGGENRGYYRIGRDLDANGNAAGGWTNPVPVPGWFGAEDQGGGIAIADLNGNGRPDLVVYHIDNPAGENRGYYRIGWNLDANGNVGGGWTNPTPIAGWFGTENQGGSIALTDLNGNGRRDLIVYHIDNPRGENHGYYRVIKDL